MCCEYCVTLSVQFCGLLQPLKIDGSQCSVVNVALVVQENGLTDKLVSLALLGNKEDMTYAAQYLEKLPGYQHNAIILYHKASHSTRSTIPHTVVTIIIIENKIATNCLATEISVANT